MNPKKFAISETLSDGTVVRIRAVRPEDKAAVAAFFGRLDPESIYRRFFQVKPTLSDGDLRTATDVDFGSVVALIVTIGEEGDEQVVGGGRYVRLDSPGADDIAELGFLIEEDFHGRGIAGRLLRHLIHFARAQGVRQFEADVLVQNRAMLEVFARSGLPMKRERRDGVVHVTLSLEEKG